MPGIDFDRLRREITMAQVLHLLAFEPAHRAGPQWYGRCPLHQASTARSRPFSVNVVIGRYYCHRCHSHGHQLELWAAATRRPLHQAAIELCRALHREVPWVHRC
jgi:hypothetical protein